MKFAPSNKITQSFKSMKAASFSNENSDRFGNPGESHYKYRFGYFRYGTFLIEEK